MKTFLLSFSLLLLFQTKSFSQKDLPPVFEINTDTGAYLRLSYTNWQYLLEKDQPLTIRDVTSPRFSSQFTSPDSPFTKTGIRGTVWIRYHVRNNLPKPLAITLPLEGTKADFYISEKPGTWKHYLTGYDVAWSKRDGLKGLVQIPYTIKAKGEITVYQSHNNGVLDIYSRFFVGIKNQVLAEYYAKNGDRYAPSMSLTLLTGFFLFAAIFNFFFYYTVRERVYLTYSILLFLSALFSPPLFDLILREAQQYRELVVTVSRAFLGYLVVRSILDFLHASQNHPRWNRWLSKAYRFFMIYIAGGYIYSFWDKTGQSTPAKIFIGFGLVLLTFIFTGFAVIIITDLFRKRRASRLFSLAVTPFLLYLVCQILLGLFKEKSIPYLYEASIIWAITILSWSLFDRFKGLLHENAQQALERERLLREKEEERSQLITRQNELLEQQVRERTAELSQSLAELKQTQSQLIQSEKLASLGELTAGIAHEIQNPLNFVNNFSEVSVELIDEMQTELDAGNREEVEAIAGDIKQNLEKIHHHGKRADAIVKNMLQHSRNNSGERQLTDINTLADEYLRLSYHGLRAKDKSFNASLTTSFQPGLPQASIIPQDMGRVLLNLFNNAFYAVNQKSKTAPADYKPEVIVATAAIEKQIQISIKDNGTGIPESIKEKILQPFFTTKPTGEGTGLGLSLSYDIVVKGHGGTLRINSKEGAYSEFIITLPA
ncbi:MAG: hypothetical protein INR73_01465 [Williamsia sp.]|nr:hypothetical protein [Williamsia sp.]